MLRKKTHTIIFFFLLCLHFMETFIFREFCKSLFYKKLNVAEFALLAFLQCVGEPANLGSVSQTMYVIK